MTNEQQHHDHDEPDTGEAYPENWKLLAESSINGLDRALDQQLVFERIQYYLQQLEIQQFTEAELKFQIAKLRAEAFVENSSDSIYLRMSRKPRHAAVEKAAEAADKKQRVAMEIEASARMWDTLADADDQDTAVARAVDNADRLRGILKKLKPK